MKLAEVKQMIIKKGNLIEIMNHRFGTYETFLKMISKANFEIEIKTSKRITTQLDFLDQLFKPITTKIFSLMLEDKLDSLTKEFVIKEYQFDILPNIKYIKEGDQIVSLEVEYKLPDENRKVELKPLGARKIENDELEELKQDTLKYVLENKAEFLDEYGADILAILFRLNVQNIGNVKDEEYNEAMRLSYKYKNIDTAYSKLIYYALIHSPLRYAVKHNAIDLFISTRTNIANTQIEQIEILEDGFTKKQVFLSENEQRNLNIYHNTAFFDLLVRLVQMGKIKGEFAVAKGTMKITHTNDVYIVTNETIKELLEVNDFEATKIKNAIYELTELVLVGERKDGAKVGIYPIRKRGFIETKTVKIDVFEIDKVLLRNGKLYIPMIPNAFSKILQEVPSKQKNFVNDVYQYLLSTRNTKTYISLLSTRDFSKKFPNSLSEQRKHRELEERIEKALEILYKIRLIEEYTKKKNHWEVRLRN